MSVLGHGKDTADPTQPYTRANIPISVVMVGTSAQPALQRDGSRLSYNFETRRFSSWNDEMLRRQISELRGNMEFGAEVVIDSLEHRGRDYSPAKITSSACL